MSYLSLIQVEKLVHDDFELLEPYLKHDPSCQRWTLVAIIPMKCSCQLDVRLANYRDQLARLRSSIGLNDDGSGPR